MKRLARFVAIGASVAVTLGCSDPPTPVEATATMPKACAGPTKTGGYICDVSMAALLANGDRYDGVRVITQGYIHFEFEGNAIYLHKEDLDRNLSRNGLWVTLAKDVEATACQDAYVIVEGTFRAGLGGHFALWSGALDDITRCARLD